MRSAKCSGAASVKQKSATERVCCSSCCRICAATRTRVPSLSGSPGGLMCAETSNGPTEFDEEESIVTPFCQISFPEFRCSPLLSHRLALKVLAKPIAFNPPIAALQRYHPSFAAYGRWACRDVLGTTSAPGDATTIGNITAAQSWSSLDPATTRELRDEVGTKYRGRYRR